MKTQSALFAFCIAIVGVTLFAAACSEAPPPVGSNDPTSSIDSSEEGHQDGDGDSGEHANQDGHHEGDGHDGDGESHPGKDGDGHGTDVDGRHDGDGDSGKHNDI